MMKKRTVLILLAALVLSLSACEKQPEPAMDTYDAIVTPVSEAVTNTAIASVLFIIAWDAV